MKFLAALAVGLMAFPPLPPNPKPRLLPPRAAALFNNPPIRAVVAPKTYRLVWEHSDPNAVEFDVEAGPTPMGPWKQIATTERLEFPLTADLKQCYFRVGAHWRSP